MLGRRIKRVILTTLAWGGVGVVITLYDHLAYLMFEGTTPYDLGVALQTGVLGALVGGGIGVSLTVFLLRPRGRGHSFLASVAIHTLTYTVTILVMTVALTFVFQSRILGEGLLTERVADASVVYLSGAGPAKFVMVWIIVGGITAVFHALSDHLGPDIFGAFLLGRYRTPRVERRTVMFLDLVGSTTIAERLGNVRYFELLQTLFADMTGPLARRRGHVYQYVGDEVVLTWVGESAFHQDACVACFFDIVEIIERKADVYERAFSVRPRFRAGLHVGPVTTGELGVWRTAIVHSGDVLNTAARIQGRAKEIDADLLVSEAIATRLDSTRWVSESLGRLELRGKEERVEVLRVRPAGLV